jgi:hypothetical protein
VRQSDQFKSWAAANRAAKNIPTDCALLRERADRGATGGSLKPAALSRARPPVVVHRVALYCWPGTRCPIGHESAPNDRHRGGDPPPSLLPMGYVTGRNIPQRSRW